MPLPLGCESSCSIQCNGLKKHTGYTSTTLNKGKWDYSQLDNLVTVYLELKNSISICTGNSFVS